jgi:hypothetical protein
MSTPNGDDPGHQWAQPGDPTRPVPQPAPSGYGTPSSPSYGKYGQGQALPPPPPVAPAPQWDQQQGQWGPPQPGPGQWGQPGYAPQQQWRPPGAPAVLKLVGGLQTAVILLSMLLGVFIVVSAALAPNQHQLLVDTFNGELVPVSERGSVGYQTLSSMALLVQVATWVLACLWLTRVRQNAMVLQPRPPRHSETWIWLGWVIPVINLWFPKQILDDVIAATAAGTGMPRIRTGWWWTAWLSSMVLSLVLGVASVLPPNDAVHGALVALDAVVLAIGLLLWIGIVRRISVAQDAQIAKPELATLGQ